MSRKAFEHQLGMLHRACLPLPVSRHSTFAGQHRSRVVDQIYTRRMQQMEAHAEKMAAEVQKSNSRVEQMQGESRLPQALAGMRV